jgi:N-methylhydantoinase A
VSRSVIVPSGQRTPDYEQVFADLEKQAAAALGNVTPVKFERLGDLRYSGQSWELTVPWPANGSLENVFAQAHKQRYGYDRSGEPVEVVTLRVRAQQHVDVELPAMSAPVAASADQATVVLAGGESVVTRVVPRTGLARDEVVAGPAIVTQADSTTFLAPGWTARTNDWGEMILHRE